MTSKMDVLGHVRACELALMTAAARYYPRARYMSAIRAHQMLKVDGEHFSLGDVSAALQGLQSRMLGVVVKNEEDEQGFIWHQMPAVAMARLVESMKSFDSVRVYPLEPTVETVDFDYEDSPLCHVFMLRPDCAVRMELPENLDEEDVDRLTQYLRGLIGDGSNEDSTWPFSRRRRPVEDDLEEVTEEDEFEEDEEDEFNYIEREDEDDSETF